MKPLAPVAPGTRVVLGVSFFILFVAVWAVATFGGFVPKTFLADPWTMLRSGYDLLVNQGFVKDIGMTVWRVVGGFAIAAAIAWAALDSTSTSLSSQARGAWLSSKPMQAR